MLCAEAVLAHLAGACEGGGEGCHLMASLARLLQSPCCRFPGQVAPEETFLNKYAASGAADSHGVCALTLRPDLPGFSGFLPC